MNIEDKIKKCLQELGEKIKIRREELGLSQRELAEKIGYSDNSAIVFIEHGKTDIPLSRIIKFAQVLGLPVDYLVSWEEVQKNNDAIADIVLQLRSDPELLEIVLKITNLTPDQRSAIEAMLNAFVKA